MPLYRLWPTDEGLSHRDWTASGYQGSCLVSANNEADAREIAKHGFGKALEHPPPGRDFPQSPWPNPDLVNCMSVADLTGAVPPRGTIVMPPESGWETFVAPGI